MHVNVLNVSRVQSTVVLMVSFIKRSYGGGVWLSALNTFLHVAYTILFLFLLEVTSQSSQLSSGLLCPVETDPPQPPTVSSQSVIDGSYASPSVAPPSLPLTPCQSPHPSLDSTLSLTSSPVYDPPPIQNSPWTESSLDQPYQKNKKSRSSSKTR